MVKLTLSVNPEVIAKARSYAAQHRVSVSRMVETYLVAVTARGPVPTAQSTPVLSALTGVIRQGDVADYREHLKKKYR